MKFYNRVNELSIIRENEKQSYDSAGLWCLPAVVE